MSESGTERRPCFQLTVNKRETSVRLLQAVTGQEPLTWSEDHRLAVCTSSNVSVLEQVCDSQSSNPELTLQRTSLPAPPRTCILRVLIGHVEKKMNKQMFPEYCSLCKKVLPFNDTKKAICPNGHVWLRCFLTYQACQTLEYRSCLLRDSIARHPVPEDLEWIKKLLKGPCTLCDSPMF